jgi:hypothetical protein
MDIFLDEKECLSYVSGYKTSKATGKLKEVSTLFCGGDVW